MEWIRKTVEVLNKGHHLPTEDPQPGRNQSSPCHNKRRLELAFQYRIVRPISWAKWFEEQRRTLLAIAFVVTAQWSVYYLDGYTRDTRSEYLFDDVIVSGRYVFMPSLSTQLDWKNKFSRFGHCVAVQHILIWSKSAIISNVGRSDVSWSSASGRCPAASSKKD